MGDIALENYSEYMMDDELYLGHILRNESPLDMLILIRCGANTIFVAQKERKRNAPHGHESIY